MLNPTMNSVWTVTENRGEEINLLKIAETKKVAENYVKGRFSSRFDSNNEWLVTEDQLDLKAWADVDKDEFAKCIDPGDYFDEYPGYTHLIIEKWSVLRG